MKHHRSKICALAVIAVAIVAAPTYAQIDPKKDPAAWWADFIVSFQTLGNSSDPAKEAKMRTSIDKVFNYEAMGDRVLESVPAEWRALPIADQTRFRSAFRQLIQQYLYRFLRTCHKTPPILDSDKRVILHESDPNCPDSVAIKYQLDGSVLLIVDIFVEDLSLVQVYKNQIVQSIKVQKGFDPVIDKMQQTLARMKTETP